MVIFHSYVSLPEGISHVIILYNLLLYLDKDIIYYDYYIAVYFFLHLNKDTISVITVQY